MNEAAVQAAIRVRAAELGVRPWRNNIGVFENAAGRPVRCGLANDSAQLNKRLKSGDLIGWLPVGFDLTQAQRDFVDSLAHEPRPAALGRTGVITSARLSRFLSGFAVFLSVECKAADWRISCDDPYTQAREHFNDREEAQAKWIDLVRGDGGIAFFARSVAEFERELRKAGFNA